MDQDDAEAVSLFEKEADRLSQGGRYFDPLYRPPERLPPRLPCPAR